MDADPIDFCSRALAYVKVALPAGGGDPIHLSDDQAPVFRELAEGLLVFYVVDIGPEYQWVQRHHLRQAGITEDELHFIGLSNLANRANERLQIVPYSNIFAMLMGGDFEASLVAVDDLWDRILVPHAPNGIVAALPARDILGICDARSEEGLRELAELLDRSADCDHPLTRTLYRREAGRWHSFTG